MGLVLDSSVLIDAERRHWTVAAFLRQLRETVGPQDVALSTISIAELTFGIHRANSIERHARRRKFLDDLKTSTPIISVSAEVAELAGKLNAETSGRGVVVPFDDLLIGACALEQGYAVATRNPRHFRLIPGLMVVHLESLL